MDAPNATLGNLTCDPSVTGYRYFGAALGIAVSLVGTLGNVMTVLAFAVEAKLRTRFNLLILNLTLADLLYCAFLQPITVDTYVHLSWRQGDTMCRLFGLLLFTANSVSIFNLAIIAASRYVLVSDPRRFDRVYSRYAMPVFLAGPWLVSLALFAPLWGVYEFLGTVCTCSFNRTRGRPYTTVLMLLLFGAGLGSIGFFYFLVDRRAKAATRAVREHGQGAPRVFAIELASEPSSEPSSGPRWAGAEGRASGSAGRSEFARVTRMCLAMFLVFLACYLPFCLLNVADAGGHAPALLHMVAANLTWLNSCINPVLYAAMNRRFAEAYWALLGKVACPCAHRGR